MVQDLKTSKVKRVFAIFLLSLYLFSGVKLNELMKVNVVVNHFAEHQRLDHSITVYQFLVMHYVTDDNNQNDNKRDMELPFRSSESFSSCSISSFLLSVQSDFFSNNFIQKHCEEIPNADSEFISHYFASIWQPPQLV